MRHKRAVRNIPIVLFVFIIFLSASRFALGSGTILGWGYRVVGPVNGKATKVAVGWNHSLALMADGSIAAWGSNGYGWGQCNVPSPNADFIGMAGGESHSLGLKADGSVVAWGYNLNGQCNVPSPNAGFVAVAAGGNHSLGLKADGSIVGWGGTPAV